MIQYTEGDGNDTIYNFNSDDTISITGNSSYTTLRSGDNTIVSIIGSGSITLYNDSYINVKGGKYVSSKYDWEINGTAATYGTSSNILITVSGLKNNAPVNGITLSGNVVTLSDSVLNQVTVTISDGYTLQLADNVTKTSTTAANWSVNGTTATYKAASTSAGYTLSSDGKSISYIPASGGNTLVTVSGLKNNVVSQNGVIDGINIENKVVKVSAKLVGDSGVKLSGSGYNLEIVTGEPIPEGISIKNNILTTSNKFTGSTINLNDEWAYGVTKVNADVVSHGINIAGDNADNSIKGGKGADIFVYAGGNDIITDYKAGEDKIKIDGTISNTSYKGKDVIFEIGGGTLTVKNAKDKEITFTDSNAKTLDLLYDNNFAVDDFGIDDITEQKFTVTEIQTLDNLKEFNSEDLTVTYGETLCSNSAVNV